MFLSRFAHVEESMQGTEVIEKTMSICPSCEKKIPAEIYKSGDAVRIRKTCVQHGMTDDMYWESYHAYARAKRYSHEGRGIENPVITKDNIDCPFDCGLCKIHKSHTALANVVVTNRCDLACWYCFFYAKEGSKIYEPSLEQFREMLRNLRNERPIATNAVQFTGGEPALRDDIIDIIKIAKEEGFDHVQFNTNGIRLCHDATLAERLRMAGVNTVYLSFDGVTPKTNPKNHWEVPRALENCRKAGLGVVLVPTVIRGINDHEIGDIIRFAMANIDIVRGVNFQPVSLVGKMPRKEREKRRITIPGVLKALEEQTNGEIRMDGFYPVPCVKSITMFAEALTGERHYDLSTHFVCGAGSYVFKDGNRVVPLTAFVDADGFFQYLDRMSAELRSGKSKTIVKLKLLYGLRKFIDLKKVPRGLNFQRITYDMLVRREYGALGTFHKNSLFIGLMHFQDLYNYDVKRVQRCTIHYAVPDGRIIPFCAFNVLPEKYRDSIQEKFSIPAKEWERLHGRKISADRYVRSAETMERANADSAFRDFSRKHQAESFCVVR